LLLAVAGLSAILLRMVHRFLVLAALTSVVVSPALGGAYLYWDDSTHIINNPQMVAHDWLSFWSDQYYRLYIPVIYTVWTWLFMISDSPLMFHMFNVFLHALNGVLFFRLCGLAVPAADADVKAGRLWQRPALWIATLAFMYHPLQTEPVAWIAGARDLLSTTFALAAAIVMWKAARVPQFLLGTLLFLLSLLSKATTAPLPVALLVIPAFWAGAGRVKLAWLGAWLPLAGVVLYINKVVQQGETDNLIKPLSVGERLITMLDIFGFYTQKFFVPWPLTGDYGRIPSVVLGKQLYVMPIAIFFAAVAVLAFCKWRWRGFPLFGILFFGLMMSPVSGVVTFMAQSQSSVADRYVYLPWAGPCIMIAMAAVRYVRLRPLMLAVIACWCVVMFVRSGVYKENQTFFPNMLEYNPESFVGHTTMGVVDFSAGRFDLAEQHFKDAHRIMPLSVSPVGNLAQLYLEQKRMSDILAVIEPIFDGPGFIAFNKSNPESVARCARVIARAHMAFGRLGDANRKLCQALALAPTDPESQNDYRNFVLELQKRSLPANPCPPMPL